MFRIQLLACLAFVACGSPGAGTARAQAPAPPAKVAAIVNGEAIALEEVDAIVNLRPVRPGKVNETELFEFKCEALDMLIDDMVMRQFLRKNTGSVRASEVAKRLGELQASLKMQGQSLESYCKESGQTDAQLRASIISMIQRNEFINKHLTEDAVRQYYDDNRELFDQVTVRVSHILLRLQRDTTSVRIAAERAKLQALRDDILAGKITFADAAKKYSQCSSAPSGGDIGYFPRKGAVEEPFAKAAFALKQNEVSQVVQTSYGLHLILLTDRKSGPPSDFKKMKDQVRALAGEEMMAGILARERPTAQVEIKLEAPDNKKSVPAKRGFFGNRQ